MQSSAVLSCQTGALSRAEKCGREPRTSAEFSNRIAAPAIESCRQRKRTGSVPLDPLK